MTRITDRAIREYYGHNGVECVVGIKRNGEIHRYGSPDPADRSRDYWHYVGTRDEAVREISQNAESSE